MKIKNLIDQLSRCNPEWDAIIQLNFAEVTEDIPLPQASEAHAPSYKAGYEHGVSMVEGSYEIGLMQAGDREAILITVQNQLSNP